MSPVISMVSSSFIILLFFLFFLLNSMFGYVPLSADVAVEWTSTLVCLVKSAGRRECVPLISLHMEILIMCKNSYKILKLGQCVDRIPPNYGCFIFLLSLVTTLVIWSSWKFWKFSAYEEMWLTEMSMVESNISNIWSVL